MHGKKKTTDYVMRYANDSFQKLLDAGMPYQLVASAFMTSALALFNTRSQNDGHKNAQKFLNLLSDGLDQTSKRLKDPPAPPPTPHITGSLNDLKDLGNYARGSMTDLMNQGFEPWSVLLAFGTLAVETVRTHEGYADAKAFLERLSEMVESTKPLLDVLRKQN